MNTVNSAFKWAYFIFFLAFLFPYAVNAAEPFMLITDQEYQAQLPFRNQRPDKRTIKTRSLYGSTDRDNPVIVIKAPSLAEALQAPIAIDIEFKANEDAYIASDSLRVLYGWLNLDITDRIREHAKISISGLSAENVKLPVGEHSITIEISDSKYRTAQKEVNFKVTQ